MLLDLLTFLLGHIATLLGDYVMAPLVISNRLTHCLENAATFILKSIPDGDRPDKQDTNLFLNFGWTG